MKNKVLVTGATGFVGGRIAQSLALREEIEVVLGSRAVQESPWWLPSAPTVVMNWTSQRSLKSACNGIDTLVHLSGMNDADCSLDPVGALEINAVNTARLMKAAKVAGVKRVIYFSTAQVYGSNLVGRIDESTLPKNYHPYATSHRAAEDVVLAAANSNMDSVVIRLSNGFGVPAHPNVNAWMLLTNDLCRQAVVSKIMTLRSSGLQQRDFITLNDVTRVVKHILELPRVKLGDGLFNVGSGKSMQVRDMAQLIQVRCTHVLGFTPIIIRPESISDEKDEALYYCIDKLLNTGLTLNGNANYEIDAILQMCHKNFTVAD
ncbi:SDR family oxidoreductase [Candidatus Thioglobus sp.]|nr:SDR family oxidoreductase [Candidatus Thioglobus sp.]